MCAHSVSELGTKPAKNSRIAKPETQCLLGVVFCPCVPLYASPGYEPEGREFESLRARNLILFCDLLLVRDILQPQPKGERDKPKTGVCYQCRGLRDFCREGHKGIDLVQIEPPTGEARSPERLLDARLSIAKTANLEDGTSNKLHALFFDSLTRQEESSQ